MTDSNILEMAKLGDPQAIEFLMNQSLQSRGMQAKVDRQGDCLEVTLEAERVPNRQALTAFVQKGISNLGAPSIRLIRIVGQQVGASYPAWMQELEMSSGDVAPLLIQPETGSDLTVNQSLDNTLIQSLEDTTIQSREDTTVQDTTIQSLDELIGPDGEFNREPDSPAVEPPAEPDPAPESSDAKSGLEAGLLGLGAVGAGIGAGFTASQSASQPASDLDRTELSADLWAEESQEEPQEEPQPEGPETTDFLQDLQKADSPELTNSLSSDLDALDQPDDGVLDFLNELTPDPALEDFPAEQPQAQSAYLGGLANESTTEADFQELIAASSDAIEPMPSELWADEPEPPSGEPDADLLDFLNQPDPEPLPESLNAAELLDEPLLDEPLLDEPAASEPDWLAELTSPETSAEASAGTEQIAEQVEGVETAFADYSAVGSPERDFDTGDFDTTDPNPVSEQQIEELFAAESAAFNGEPGFIEEPLSEESYREDLWPEQPPADNTDLLQALVESPATETEINLDNLEPESAEPPAADLVPPDFMMEHDIEWDSEDAVLEQSRLSQPTAEFTSPAPAEETDQQILSNLERADLSSAYPDAEATTEIDPALDPEPASFDLTPDATDPFADPLADPTEAAALPAVGVLETEWAGDELVESEGASPEPVSELPDSTTSSTASSTVSYWASGSDDDFEEIPPDFLQDLANESPEFSEFVTAPLPVQSESDLPMVTDATDSSDPAVSPASQPASSLEDDLNSLELLPPEDFTPLELPPDLEPSGGLSADSDWGRLELEDSEPVEPSPILGQPDVETNETSGSAVAPLPPVNLSQDTLEQGLGDFRQEVEPLPDEFFAESESAGWQSDLRQPLDLETPGPDDTLADTPPDYTPPPLPPDPSSEGREPSLLWALVPLSSIIGGVLGFMLLRSRMAPLPAPPSESPAPAAPTAPAPPAASPSPTSSNPSSNPDALKTALERADSAVTLGQTAQSVDDWKLVASRWQQAIDQLETIPASSPDYRAARSKLAEYQGYLTVAQGRANQPIVAAAPLGAANVQTESPNPAASPAASPGASPAASPGGSPTSSPVAAVTCLPIASTATSQPVELSRLQFEPVPDRTQANPLIGCITNHTEQPIASVNLAYSAPPARPATGKLSFSELNPKQTVPFKSEFTLPPPRPKP
ncbi:MAG: hypothetical protein ACKO7W_01920 [Elainella sp.]